MENREQQILSEIKTMMSSIRSQLELLDMKMVELQQAVEPQDIEMIPIDLDIDIADHQPAAEPVAEEPVVEEPMEAEVPVEDDLPVAEDEPVAEEAAVVEDPVDDDLPMFLEPEPVPGPVAATVIDLVTEPEPKQAVIDAMTAKQAWRTDMPGTPVKDIRSAISLNDRIFFINYLFNEDPMAFQDSLTRINQMGSLDEVVGLVVTEHPEWDMDSDVVYRFMMAVRRRIR